MGIESRNEQIILDRTSGLTLEELSKKYSLSTTQLSRIIGNIKPDRSNKYSKSEWLEPRLSSGMTVRQMSLEAGVPVGTMRYWVKKSRGKTKRYMNNKVFEIEENWDSKEWFYKQYHDENLGMSTISKMINKSVGFVSDRLKKYGIERRSHSDSMAKFKRRPAEEWLIKHYINLGWSIKKCADEYGVRFDTILNALRDYNISERSASEQQRGRLNSFYGKQHTEETKRVCVDAGSKYGAEYWLTGDVEAKRELQSIISSDVWSDPDRRRLSSERISQLCKVGKCNPKSRPYHTKSGDVLLLRSSWEEVIARWLDDCDIVKAWFYEDVVIQYMDGDGDIKNFVVDFRIIWVDDLETLLECKNEHLLSKENEQLKIEAMERYSESHNFSTILISTKQQIKLLLDGYKHMVVWRSDNLYSVPKKYLDLSSLNIEAIKHEIISKVCPWSAFRYSQNELSKDIDRLKNENLNGYFDNEKLKSTAPNSGGMPGKKIITHFQPHFWDVPVKNNKPFPIAFNDKKVIYNCLNISISENESLSSERLLREIGFHYTNFNRTSHFATGFARNIIKLVDCSGMRVFDPCCGWGGRLLAAWLEECKYFGFDISPETVNGLIAIADFVGFDVDIKLASCVDSEWPSCDLIFTSPPFFNTERYIGGDQPHSLYNSRDKWLSGFIKPFCDKCISSGAVVALYLDENTKLDFENFLNFAEIIEIFNRRHARRKIGHEYLCLIK